MTKRLELQLLTHEITLKALEVKANCLYQYTRLWFEQLAKRDKNMIDFEYNLSMVLT